METMDSIMKKYIKNYYYIKPKRVKSVLKIRPICKSLNNTKNASIVLNSNNSPKNKFHFSKKPETIRLLTEYSTIPSPFKLSSNINRKYKKNKTLSMTTKKPKISNELEDKKFLRGKLKYLVKNNIILCEKKFNPKSFTESISHVHVKEFKNRFRNINNRNKVGIFTNKFPAILNTNKFYSRYFDYFISPDELLNKNFNKKEIFQIKTDPNYFNFGNNYKNVSFFKKKTLKETLNEEEKIGPNNLMEASLKKSLKQTKKRIGGYLNYYTSVMSRQGFIGAS